ncbi:uncharacterized protein LOC129611423 [Condylostylus longicornis]|uniref:uncharacterized protein LOC129611423 n=1 Tax=Condylostylus longicornis TaxID=2530218 RepID=UPI00244E0359|nr:uncharacterized protein LOC129611423 [Condylostylus longicornis]XP_055380542.1 uncharacterized protein LOC129611423 [Condylostylus longicornis]XP_055380543.1 uncharacterized protein LOC129611423 [Condylostylus longicornis]XP_055380544.1 uncharacterized protein LOC129611423 [Condylostylus longicornis]
MSDNKFEEKWQELQKFVPFLQRIISNLKRQMKDKPRVVQLEKMEMLHELLTKRDKTKLKYETLVKCETLLNKIYSKVEKIPLKPVVMSTEVVEISEPDSPPPGNQIAQEYRPPIEIPTERELSPESHVNKTISNPNESKMVISSDLSLEELLKRREQLENKLFNCNTNSNSNSSNEVSLINEPKRDSETNKNSNSIINYDHFDIESKSDSPSSANKFLPFMPNLLISNKLLLDKNEKGGSPKNWIKRTDPYESPQRPITTIITGRPSPPISWKDDFIEQQPKSPVMVDEVKKIRDKKLELWSKNDKYSEAQNLKSKRRTSTPDWDAEIEEEERLKNEKKINKKMECSIEYGCPNNVDPALKGPSNREKSLESSRDRNKDKNRLHTQKQSRWDVENIDDIEKQHSKDRHKKLDLNSEKANVDHSSSRTKLSPPPILSHVTKYLDDIESSESCSLSPIDSSDSNLSTSRTVKIRKGEDLKVQFQSDEKNILEQQRASEENLIKVHLTSAATSSVKSLQGEDLKIQVLNEKFRPQKPKNVGECLKKLNASNVSSNLIIDVLKSPPLSANDIDDLLHESGSENTVEPISTCKPNLSEVRKKLAKISTKLNQNNIINDTKRTDFEHDSIDNPIQNHPISPIMDSKGNDRLALKYHPHTKKNSNNNSNIESDVKKNRCEKLVEFNNLKTSSSCNANSVINNFPTVNPNDPRLKNKPQFQECNKNINEQFQNLNSKEINKPLSNIGNPIPTLLGTVVPNPLGNLLQSNVKLAFPSNLIDIPLQVNIPLPTTSFQQQPLQQIPVVTIPKSTFSDFLNNKNHLKHNNSNDQIGYNKINPIQNDNFERQKYLESKKSKEDCTFTTHLMKTQNAQPKTYGEYRRQCELEKNKVSKADSNKISSNFETSLDFREIKDNGKTNQIASVATDDQQVAQTRDSKQTISNPISKAPRQLSKRRDSLITKSETEKHSKLHVDGQCSKTLSSHSANVANKNSMLTSSSEIVPICKFKIPKKSKDDEMKDEQKIEVKKTGNLKEEEAKSISEKHEETIKTLDISNKRDELFLEDQNDINCASNITESIKNTSNLKIDDKNKSNEHVNLNSENNNLKDNTTTKISSKSKRKFIPLKTGETTASESKIQQRRKSVSTSITQRKELCESIAGVSNEQAVKLTIRRKSMSATTSSDNNNFEIKPNNPEITNFLEKEKQDKNCEFSGPNKDETESLQSFDTTTDSTSVSSYQGGVKTKRSKRYNNYYYEVAPDPIDNTKLSVENIIEGKRRSRSLVNMNESSLAIPKYVSKNKSSNNNVDFCSSSEDVSSIGKEKNITKKNIKSKITESHVNETDHCNSFEADSLKSAEADLKNTNIKTENTDKSETTKEVSSLTKGGANESASGTVESLLNFLGPNSNKESLLEILSKVCDEKKFEKIKAILEEDEKSDKSENLKEESFKEDEVTDSKKQEDLRTNMKTERKLRHKTELDRLNEDIRDMFISQGVLSAFGKRNQLQSIKSNEPVIADKKNITSKDKNKKIFRAKELKVILKKIKINYLDQEKVEFKTKLQPKRKRRFAWAKGQIAKKKSASPSAVAGRLNKATKRTGVATFNPRAQINKKVKSKDFPYYKPCPKSKKSTLNINETNSKAEIDSEELKQKRKILFLENNEVPSKNIYKEMHAKSEYCKKCLVCHKINIQKLVSHHVDTHPEYEVFISRLPPDTLNDLCSDRHNSALYQYMIKSRGSMFHYRCPFCDIQQTATRSVWLDHFSTHTGEFHYKCSGCNKQSNWRKPLLRHIKTICKTSRIITRESPSSILKNISGYLCNICNYVQLTQNNIIKHLNTQHSPKEKKNFRKINLMNMENVPKLDNPPSEETKVSADENVEDVEDDTEMIKAENSNISDKLDVFIPKEHTDLNVDKNLLNYMNEVITFSVQTPKINERTSKSIVDELSERLKSQNSSVKKKEVSVRIEKDIEKTTKEKNMSIVDLLSQRFQNISESDAMKNKEGDDKEESESDNETPVVYILDKIDDDNLDDIELAESSEQVILSINKPISNSRAEILDKIGGSTTAQLNLKENDREITDSIYATLNEKLKNSKSPDKKITTKNDSLKSNQKKSGITIIDRLNKRLKEATGVAPVGGSGVRKLAENKKNLSIKKKVQETVHTVDNEDRSALDSSDDNLVIDEDCTTPVPDINANSVEKTNKKQNESSTHLQQLSSEQNEINEIEDDDDCWEDIEEVSPQSNENDEQNLKVTAEKIQSKEKNNTIFKTLSKIYVSFGKNKQKPKKKSMDIRNCGSSTPPVITDESCDSNLENNGAKQQQQPIPLSDLISDAAIPSPMSAELTIDPPVPLPSEPLSDLNDISSLLEPTPTSETLTSIANNNSNINIISTTELSKVGVETTVQKLNINDINEPIYVLPDNVTFADALVLAAEIENTKNINKKNETENDITKPNKISKAPVTCRINNLGFSESEGKVKYFCLIKPCSFLFSDQEIGLQNHYSSDHKTICWDGYCYACEANICSEDELPLNRELKHMIEVHIKNLLKSHNLYIEHNQNSDSSKSFEEALMTNRPKITIRRLSGDLLSKNKPQDPVIEYSKLQSSVQTIPISLLSSINSPLLNSNPNVPTVIDPKSNLTISKQNVTIKDLLETPSIPPPIAPQLLPEDSSTSKAATVPIQTAPQRLQIKTYKRTQPEKPSTCILPNKQNLTISPIQNNLNSGSGLKISSVSQGITISDKEITSPIIVPPAQSVHNSAEPIKIISVSGGVANFPVEPPKISKISSNVTILPITRNNDKSQSSPTLVNQQPQQLITSDKSLVITKMASKVPIQTQGLSKTNSGFLRIENVCSLNTQKPVVESVSTQQSDANVIKSTINIDQNLSSVTTLNQSLSIASTEVEKSQSSIEEHKSNVPNESINSDTNISQTLTSNTSSEALESTMKLIKPWIFPTVSKPFSVAQFQLRAISLYALFKCMNQECFFTTNCVQNILEHFQFHEQQSSFGWLRCSYCKFVACNSANYVEHIHSVHNNDIFQCPYCFYRSCNDFNTLKHIEEYHQEQKPLIFVCHGERKRLASEMKHLAIYRNRHIKAIPCFDCNKKIFILRNYLKHILEHNVNSECYTCGICKAGGLLKKCADTHLSLVHRISVYQCIYCDMSSNLRSAMVVHMAKEHPSHLLYSCVRVSPNKSAVFNTETIENSTVLANLSENVNVKYLQPCNFSLENLNFMNPALDSQAVEQNKNIKISVNFANINSPILPAPIKSATDSIRASTPPSVATTMSNDNAVINVQSSLKISSVTSLASTSQTSVTRSPEISGTQIGESVLVKSAPICSAQIQNAFASIPVENPGTQINQQENLQTLSSTPKVLKNPVMLNKSHNAPQKVEVATRKSNSSISNTTIDETITIDDSDQEEQTENEKSPNADSRNLSDNYVSNSNITTSKNIKDILKNCTELTKSVALAQEKQEIKTITRGTIMINEVSLNLKSSQESSTNNEKTVDDSLLNKQIMEAAQEYVLDTGYEGSELYRCSLPECTNVKLSCETLSSHYSRVHQRLRQFKCPHCTCQYSNIRSLKVHLATHKRHRYFCFLCNHTTSIQQHLTKHITELHGKTGLVSFPLTNQFELDTKEKSSDSLFFVLAPTATKRQEILQFGERLVRICERRRSLTKKTFSPNEIDQLPLQAIFNSEAFCSICSYRTKVRTNMYRHLLFHKSEVKVASIDPVNPVPCLVSNEKNFDKMINMALSSNLKKDNQEKLQPSNSSGMTSSDGNLSSTTEEIKEALKKGDLKIPEFIPLMRKFICGVPNCNYLTITDYMLKCHLQTLHSEEKQYKCPHCKLELLQKKNFCADKILQHLKFHDSKIYLCGDCYYMHFLKHVVERHINDRHATAAQVDVIQYERKDTNTIITKYPCGRLIGQSNTKTITSTDGTNSSDRNTDTDVIVLSESTADTATFNKQLGDEEAKWSCTTCKFKTVDEPSMLNHINTAHNIRFRYGCFDCKFGACQVNLVKEHISDKHHNFQQRQVKSNYYRLDESDYDVVQENRPLWTRSDPYRIKHIRGILMEEEDVGRKNTKSENKKSNKLKKSLSNNSNVAEDSSNSSIGASKRKSLERKASQNSIRETDKVNDPTSVLILNENSSSSQDSNIKAIHKISKVKQSSAHSSKKSQSMSARSSISSSRDSLEENLSVVVPNEISDSKAVSSTSPERSVEIYECYYCPMKNISFKVIYTHWLLHHCKKMNEKSDKVGDNSEKSEKNLPLLARPFAFKVVGYIGGDSVEVSTYDVTKNQLSRLLKMGQRVTRFQCNKCWRLFANSISVAEHQNHEHANTSALNTHRCLTFKNRNFFICSSCGYASSLECKTAAHLLNHYDGLKKCKTCNKEFDKFLEFIRHLPKHKTTFKEFLENDKNIKEFWSKIIILFPNGLCMMRCNVPKDSKVILDCLVNIVNNEVEAALIQTAPQNVIPKPNSNDNLSEMSTEKLNVNTSECSRAKISDRKPNDEKNIKADNTLTNLNNNLEMINKISLDSDDTNNDVQNDRIEDSVPSSSNFSSLDENVLTTSKPKIIKKSKRKYEKDTDWTPKPLKKRKVLSSNDDQFDSSTDDNQNADDDDDDNIPLLTVIRNTPPIKKLEKRIKPFIGPKFTQKKYHNAYTPYSYYGCKPIAEDLNNITVKVKFGYSDGYDSDNEAVLLTCQQYSEIIPIDCQVIVEKLNPEILKLNTINLFKRKIQNKFNSYAIDFPNAIEDSSDSNSSSVKKRKL